MDLKKMRVPINTESDLSGGAGMHNTWLPPLIPVPVPAVSVEFFVPMKHPPGYLLNQNKLTTTVNHSADTLTGGALALVSPVALLSSSVVHKKMAIVQKDHDCGPMIPDITPTLVANAWYAKMWPKSSRKMAFAAATVRINGQPVACSGIVGPVSLPMVTCSEPLKLPTAISITNATKTVTVGLLPADFAAGLAAIVATMLLDYALGKAFKSAAANSYTFKNFKRDLLGNFLPLPSDWTKQGVKQAAYKWLAQKGAGSGLKLQLSRLSGDPTLKVALGTAYAGVGVEAKLTDEGFQIKLEASFLGWQRDTAGQGKDWGEPI